MKIWIAVYIIILLFLWRQYRKIKKNPEKYDDMEAIYQYEPRFRYLKPTELAWRNVADSYWRVNAIAIITLGCICAGLLSLVYYFIKKSFIPEESTCFVFYFTDILLVFSFCILQSPADSDAFQSGRCAKHNGRPETMYF